MSTQKFDYKGLVDEAKSLGLDTTGKAAVIAARIEEFKASQAATVETKTEKRGTNGVHPELSGYLQIADVVYRNFVANFCQ